MRKQRLLFGPQTHLSEKFCYMCVAVGFGAYVHQIERFADNGSGAFARIKRGIRILKNDLETRSCSAQLFSFKCADGGIFQGDVALGDMDKSHDRQSGRGFT